MSDAIDHAPSPPMLGCESCGLVSANVLDPQADDLVQHCPRCGHVLRATKPFAVQRTWACVLAAAVLYIPANALPVMVTTSALQREEHTLLGGIHELWLDGSWGLAAIPALVQMEHEGIRWIRPRLRNSGLSYRRKWIWRRKRFARWRTRVQPQLPAPARRGAVRHSKICEGPRKPAPANTPRTSKL